MTLRARLRYRLGERKRRLLNRIRSRTPLRLRRPLFSPEREFRRAVRRTRRVLADPEFQLGPWESHQPVLLELLERVERPRVLELGIGYGSTPVVLALSGSSVSLETDVAWHARFAGFATPEHRIQLWSDVSETEWRCPYLDEEWDVALVDNAPARSRQANLVALADRARFVVCHDTEELYRTERTDYLWDFSGFRHVWTCTRFPTYTTVVSNREPIPAMHLPGVTDPGGYDRRR